MARLHVTTPITDEQVRQIRAGDEVLITGYIYTARDAAHKRMLEDLAVGRPLPFDPRGAVIYYVGPTPPKPGQVIGSAGPTTSYRMDKYTPDLLQQGVKLVIGKGYRSDPVKRALVEYGAAYLVSTGGAGALLARTVEESEVIAYEDLGTEAIRRLKVKDFPTICINDAFGGDQYFAGQSQWVKPDAMVKPKPPIASE
ncbi:MAG: Fe-S-containing hydro-lyase [Symbiobacterium sp.]|jgi:hydro-lyases, Fe-S type, tartrate/fumarate subfamily, beta region|uniref:Fe-S-containing hydro-lyase n=1 Tax=Symbiobacterium sp. TaxID=1971213 RepID=UPI003464D687